MAQRLALFLFSLALSACASRTPRDYPAHAASSPEAEAAPPADVTRALRSEPPAPGADVAGWEGLSTGAQGGAQPAASEHAHHHHQHGSSHSPEDARPSAAVHQHGASPQPSADASAQQTSDAGALSTADAALPRAQHDERGHVDHHKHHEQHGAP